MLAGGLAAAIVAGALAALLVVEWWTRHDVVRDYSVGRGELASIAIVIAAVGALLATAAGAIAAWVLS